MMCKPYPKDQAGFWSGDNPWVSPKDLKSRLVVDTLDKITEEGVRHSAAHFIAEAAVLMVVRSGIRNRAIPVAMAGRPRTVNQDLESKGIEQHPNGDFCVRTGAGTVKLPPDSATENIRTRFPGSSKSFDQ